MKRFMEWRFISNPLIINEYVMIEELGVIVSRVAARTYGILAGGNYSEITSTSLIQSLVRLYTWLACAVIYENALSLEAALYLHDSYHAEIFTPYRKSHPRRSNKKKYDMLDIYAEPEVGPNDAFDYVETIDWLQEMLAYEAADVCFQQPLLKWYHNFYWELLLDQLIPMQFVYVKDIQLIVVNVTWKRFLIFYDGQVEEWAVEQDPKSNQYILIGSDDDPSIEFTEDDYIINDDGQRVIDLDNPQFDHFIVLEDEQRISDYLASMVKSRIYMLIYQERRKEKQHEI